MTPEPLLHDRHALERFCAKAPVLGNNLSVMLVPYGEALIHSYYQEAVARLCEAAAIARVGCQTNLSFSVRDFLARLNSHVGGNDVSRHDHSHSFHTKLKLWCTFHPTQTSVNPFLERCLELYQNNISFSVGAVGIPKYTGLFHELRRRLPRNIYLWINAAEGMNITYTQTEIDDFLAIDPLFSYELKDHPARPAFCRGGKETLFVEGNGDAFACPISRKNLGNIYTDFSPDANTNPQTDSRANTPPSTPEGATLSSKDLEPPTAFPSSAPTNHEPRTMSSHSPCRAASCHCYLAYSNRTDVFDVPGLQEERAFRVPNRQRAYFFDVDGTLTNASGTIPAEHVQAIERLAQKNLIFLATSLPFRFAKQTCHSIWRHIAGGVFAEGSDIRVFAEDYKKIIPLDESVASLLPETMSYIPYREDGLLHKITLQNQAPLEHPLSDFQCVYEDDTCGIVAKEASKLGGILEICKRLQLFEPFVTVVGNSKNDIPMLQYFADSVCLPTSENAAKEAAKSVCTLEDLCEYTNSLTSTTTQDYSCVIENWLREYAPLSDNKEYGTVLFRRNGTYFCGRTYQGFRTKKWWTVINGLVLGYIMKPRLLDRPIGFLHTHPHQGNVEPSSPDYLMAKLGPIFGLKIFAIGRCDTNGSNMSIRYFNKNGAIPFLKESP
ncbi:MAG: STM4011 family radical SAM protein [Gracilibacteraceae bacterium]|jgi:hypothetical protein|nr:STM4011 family radical SAM protein [Gracilibacteraceae bacterium]